MKLGVNLDHIATLRQARGSSEPSPIKAAQICITLGADYLVMHLRKDRRHIQENDLSKIAKFARRKIHLEMASSKEMLDIALQIRPGSICLVPEFPNELTTSGGLSFEERTLPSLKRTISALKRAGIKVSLFINPEANSVRTAKRLGADIVEICTKLYSEANTEEERLACLEEVQMCSILAREMGLEVHSGHGLNYENVQDIAAVEGMQCLNIGFAIIARAVFSGLPQAILDMKLLTRGL